MVHGTTRIQKVASMIYLLYAENSNFHPFLPHIINRFKHIAKEADFLKQNFILENHTALTEFRVPIPTILIYY